MSVIRVDMDRVSRRIARDHEYTMDQVVVALERAARKGKAHMVKQTPVDQGQLRNSWKVRGTLLMNDAPHAGIIERGARPHPVSREGVEAITRWVQRKLGIDAGGRLRDVRGRFVKTSKAARRQLKAEAQRAVWGIVNKLKREGQKPTWFVRSQLRTLTTFAAQEFNRIISQPPRGGR